MPEAYGTVLLKVSDELTNAILADESLTSLENMEKICAEAGVDSLEESIGINYCYVGDGFFNEGIELRNGFLDITIFGEEWMHIMTPLTKNGKNIQIYGWILAEYGYTEYYSLNEEGCGVVVDEEDDWLTNTPVQIQELFPDVFEEE